MTEERCKQIMKDLGYPNSCSLRLALEQVANETEQEARKDQDKKTRHAIAEEFLDLIAANHKERFDVWPKGILDKVHSTIMNCRGGLWNE